MKTFTEHLSAPTQNLHIPHLEDMIFGGPGGIGFAMSVLHELGKVLNGQPSDIDISVKWDGSPAIVFGPDPADDRFFVSTKSAFNRNTPKLAHTEEEIHEYFPDGIRRILQTGLVCLPDIRPMHVLQGDVLFTGDSIREAEIQGRRHYTFTPNVITYNVPVESALGQRIRDAKIGVALHTEYVGTGTSLGSYTGQPLSPTTYIALQPITTVVTFDATFDTVSGAVAFTSVEATEYELAIETASNRVAVPDGFLNALKDPTFVAELSRFINGLARAGLQATRAVDFINDFMVTLMRREDVAIASRVTERGKQQMRDRYESLYDALFKNHQGFVMWVTLHIAITSAKTLLIRKLEQAPSAISTDAGPEGFVVNLNGVQAKLVDRLNFSRRNFAGPRSR